MGSFCGNPNTAEILSLHTKDKQYVHMKLTDDLSRSLEDHEACCLYTTHKPPETLEIFNQRTHKATQVLG